MEIIYKRLNQIDGEAGFNYPDISSHFAQLALDAIDRPDEAGEIFETRMDRLLARTLTRPSRPCLARCNS